MKRKFTILSTALALFMFLAVSMGMRGQNPANGGGMTRDNVTVLSEDFNNGFAPGWTLSGKTSFQGSSGAKSLQLASSGGAGSAQTPAFSSLVGASATLTFSIASSGSNTNTLTITGNGCKVDGLSSTTALTSAETVTIAITEATTTSTITFSAVKNGGCRIDDVLVYYTTGSGSSTYSVTYNANGAISGDVPEDDTEYDSGDEVTVLGNTGSLAKTGNDWSGWCLNADGTGTVYGPDYTTTYTISANTTFYAKWTAHTHDVTMPDDDEYGSYIASEDTDVPYGTTVTLTYDPASGYENYDAIWTVNGDVIAGNTFSMPDADVTVGVTLTNYVKDQVDIDFAEVSTGGYNSWSNKVGTSGAVYAGRTAGSLSTNPKYIQLNKSTDSNAGAYHSGIITTGTGGKIKKVVVTWATKYSNTNGRYLTVYGSNTAYSETADLYDSSTYGQELGTITYSSSNSSTTASLTISGDYKYVGLLASAAMYFDKIDIYWEPSTDPSITASNVDITYDATGGNIAYTINNSQDGATLQATVASGATISNFTLGTVGASPITFTCDANSETTAKAATVTLNYVKNNEILATKDVTITQAAAPLIYTTIPALFAAATSTSTPVTINFNNWVISGVNGNQAFLTDNNGNGLIIYQSGHGFSVNNKLSGTASCNLVTFNGSAELTGLTASNTGLTVTSDGEVTEQSIVISTLSGVNTGALLHYDGLTYNGTVLVDASDNTITPYSTLFSYTLEDGKSYNVTGVFVLNNNTKRINPRSGTDIVLKADLSNTDFTGLTSFTYVATDGGPSDAQYIGVDGTDFAGNLTVTASSDYEVSTSATGTYYSSLEIEQDEGEIAETLYVRLKAGLGTGEHNGTLTFTATNLTTVVVDLEGEVTATQIYTITLNQNTGGTIEADYANAAAGTTVTLSYSDLDNCYTFGGWTVLDGSAPSVTVTNNQFTMPDSDVVVEATFTQKTFTISYSVNGVVYDVLDESVVCGGNASLYSASVLDGLVSLPSGYSLGGWTASENNATTVSSFAPTENATLYAVFVPTGATADYVKVTENLTDWSGEYLIVNEDAGVAFDGSINNSTYDNTDNVIDVTIVDITGGGKKIVSTNAIEASRFIVTKKDAAYTIKSAAGYYIGRTANSTGVHASNVTEYTNTIEYGSTVYYVRSTNNNYMLRYNNASGQNRFRYYSGASVAAIQLYKKSTPAGCTRVITKTIAAHGADGEAGWYLIASPVAGDISPTTVGNMITDELGDEANTLTASYDLYYFDQSSDKEWKNYRQNEFDLKPGKGYLYANASDVELTFAGVPYSGNGQVTLRKTDGGDCSGWNLIGNPFSTTASINLRHDTIDFYKMNYGANTGGTELIVAEGNSIAPMEGIFVLAAEDEEVMTFATAAKSRATVGNDVKVVLNLTKGSETVDRAIVRFGEGRTLPKFMLDESHAKLYIQQDNKDYAVARSSKGQGEMPVNFRAAKNGSYTLTVNPEGVEMNYLHLIDNMTGMDIDLLQTPSYTFEASTNDYESRFRLVFASGSVFGDEDSANASFAFYSNGNWIINNAGEATLQVIDINGRILSSERVNGSVSKAINGTAGVYMLRLINGEKVMVQKIVVR